MTCTHCGTELPRGAMFCGECGRAVAQPGRIVPPASVVAPQASTPAEPGLRCEQCGSVMAAADIFCGECGYVARSVTDNFSTGPRLAPPAPVLPPTPVLPPVVQAPPAPLQPPVVHAPPVPVQPPTPPTPPTPPVERPVPPAPPVPPVRPASLVQPPAGLVEYNRHGDTARIDPVELAGIPRPDDVVLLPTQPMSAPILAPATPAEDVEATRIVRRGHRGDAFVLQFSTGENVTVAGSGLLGRNPQSQPGEYFDHLVPIFDPGKSVSKTHLEFGQEAGVFWVIDRFSGNGSVVREPGAAPRRCEPGKRYRVTRGTRIDIGEQFLIIS